MKTKIRIIRLSDDQLNDVNGGYYLFPPKQSSILSRPKNTVAPLSYPAKARNNVPRRSRKAFTKGNLIGFCQDCHIFVYEYNLSLHQDHNIICAGGR